MNTSQKTNKRKSKLIKKNIKIETSFCTYNSIIFDTILF